MAVVSRSKTEVISKILEVSDIVYNEVDRKNILKVFGIPVFKYSLNVTIPNETIKKEKKFGFSSNT